MGHTFGSSVQSIGGPPLGLVVVTVAVPDPLVAIVVEPPLPDDDPAVVDDDAAALVPTDVVPSVPDLPA
jgi:hypothetical protein